MRSHVSRTVGSVSVALLASLALAGSVLAAPPNWTAAEDVRVRNNVFLRDADFSNHNVAVTWAEPDSPRRVGVRTSTDNGASFGPTTFFGGTRQSAVDICGGSELNLAMSHKLGPGNWFIEHAQSSVDGTVFTTTPVAPTDGVQHDPDLACARGRIFVAWFEGEGSGDRMWVSHALRTGGGFSAPMDLGFDSETFFGYSLATAGADDMAYVVFQRSSGDLRLQRFSVGPGPTFTVTALPGQVIAPASSSNEASFAVVAADGNKVAVSWFRCGGIFARVSNDQGATWGPIRKLIDAASCDGDFAAAPNSVAVQGDRIVVTYSAASAFGGGWVGLFRTMNDFATFSDDPITNKLHLEHLVGYLTVGGKTRLAAVFQRDDAIRFRRQI